MATAPNVTYTITYRGLPVELGSTIRASYIAGFNQINVIFRSDISLRRYEVRVTKVDEEDGVGIGTLAYFLAGSITANVDHTHVIDVNNTNFIRGDATYKISMHAQSAIDDTWDVTVFLFTVDGLQLVDSEEANLQVYVSGSDLAVLERTTPSEIYATNFTNYELNDNTLEVN